MKQEPQEEKSDNDDEEEKKEGKEIHEVIKFNDIDTRRISADYFCKLDICKIKDSRCCMHVGVGVELMNYLMRESLQVHLTYYARGCGDYYFSAFCHCT